jgi:hypothetical protein
MKISWNIYKVTFWLFIICLIGTVITIYSSLNYEEFTEFWYFIGNWVMRLTFLFGFINSLALTVVISYLDKSPILWWLGAIFFAPLGLVVAFIRISGFMKEKNKTT